MIREAVQATFLLATGIDRISHLLGHGPSHSSYPLRCEESVSCAESESSSASAEIEPSLPELPLSPAELSPWPKLPESSDDLMTVPLQDASAVAKGKMTT